MKMGQRILVVDDDEGMTKTLSLILNEEGYETTSANNGREAIKMVNEKKFDLILIDMKMPGLNGAETYKEIKKIRPGTPVLVMTAYAVEDLVSEALRNNAKEVIYKPFDIEKLLELINKFKEGTVISIIDDDPIITSKLKDSLEEKGYRTHIATNGTEAIELIKRENAHIVFIDIEIPPSNGLDTYLKIKEINPRTTVIILTEYKENSKSLAGEAIKLNAFTCLYKPFETDEVLQLIEKIQKIKKPYSKNSNRLKDIN